MNQKLLADIAHFAPTAGSMFCTQLHTATAQHAHTRSMCLALPQRLNIGKFKQAIELALHQENLSVSHESAQPSDVRLRQIDILPPLSTSSLRNSFLRDSKSKCS